MFAPVQLRTLTLTQQQCNTLPTKSPHQQHLNTSTNKNLQLMVINTPAGTNVISASCFDPNIWLTHLLVFMSMQMHDANSEPATPLVRRYSQRIVLSGPFRVIPPSVCTQEYSESKLFTCVIVHSTLVSKHKLIYLALIIGCKLPKLQQKQQQLRLHSL